MLKNNKNVKKNSCLFRTAIFSETNGHVIIEGPTVIHKFNIWDDVDS